jgi:acid phosphatase (class A)
MHPSKAGPALAGAMFAILAWGLLISASPAGDSAPAIPANPLGKPYLAPADLPDSLLLVPPPPVPGSGALLRDEDASKAGLALRGGPRWQVAAADADLTSPQATGAMSCAAGFEISPAATPAIDRLLRRLLPDLGFASRPSKIKYSRPRPFMVNGAPSCTPEAEVYLRKDGSYPSGHSTIGYGWGMVMAEIVPDRAARAR